MTNLKSLYPYLLIAPTLPFFILGLIYPWCLAFYYSFLDYRPAYGIEGEFNGLDNYIALLTDPEFHHSLLVTLEFLVASVTIEFFLGLAIALLLNRDFKGKRIVTVIVVLPMLIAPSVVGITWRFLLLPLFGPFWYIIKILGFGEVDFLATEEMALPTAILIEVWQWTSFVALVLLAGLTAIPSEQYEAAKVDGASRWAQFRHVTLPWLRPLIVTALLFRTMFSFRTFETVYLVLGPQGGVNMGAELLGILLSWISFQIWDLGRGAALSFIMLIITVLISIGFVVTLYKEVEL